MPNGIPPWEDSLSLLSLKNLFQKYPIVTRKLLLIRPKLPNDYFTGVFVTKATKELKKKANSLNWDVHDLQGNAATRANVQAALKNFKPDFIVHYDHGGTYSLSGQNNNQKETVLDLTNVGLLSGHALSTVSCYSANGLGPAAIAAGARAYLGYGNYIYVTHKYLGKFVDAANAANYALLEGKTFGQAKKIGYAAFNKQWQDLLTVDTVVAANMLSCRDGLTHLGDPRVVGRPIGIVLNT